jgi:hypothetical protein
VGGAEGKNSVHDGRGEGKNRGKEEESAGGKEGFGFSKGPGRSRSH